MQPHHFSNRLKSARQQADLSLRDLTTRLNNKISRQSISQYENGAMRPNHTNLLRLCEALGVSIEYFNRPVIKLTEIEFRELEKLPVKERQQIETKAADFLGRFLELEDLLGAEIRFENPLSNNLITNFEDVEKVAIELREKWGLGDSSFLPNIFQKQPIKSFVKNKIAVHNYKKNSVMDDYLRFIGIHGISNYSL